MTTNEKGLRFTFDDAWLIDGVRTPFVDYTGAFAQVSPIDLGIKAARAVIDKAGIDPADIGTTVAGSMAQASFDAYMTPRHIGIYAGVPVERPAHLVQRICGTGIEVILQAAELVNRGRIDIALGVGTESMSRNPVAAYTHRNGFKMGQVEFKDFLWEALLDPACSCTMGDTAENLAKQYAIAREEVDRFAERSFARAVAAQEDGFLAGEIVPVTNETFEIDGFNPRGIKLPRKVEVVSKDSHVRPSPYDDACQDPPGLRRCADGRQFICRGRRGGGGADRFTRLCAGKGQEAARAHRCRHIGRCSAAYHGYRPGSRHPRASRRDRHCGLDQIGRIEINEAFGAQIMACMP